MRFAITERYYVHNMAVDNIQVYVVKQRAVQHTGMYKIITVNKSKNNSFTL